MYAPLDCHWHFCIISTATSGPIVWPTCGMFAGEKETGGGLFSLVLQCIHNHLYTIRDMTDMTNTIFAHKSHLWSRLRDHLCAIIVGQSSPTFSSNVCFQSCQLSVHIFSYLPGCCQSFFFFFRYCEHSNLSIIYRVIFRVVLL